MTTKPTLRQMIKQLPYCSVANLTGNLEIIEPSRNWVAVDSSNVQFPVAYQTYFDCSGWTEDELTFFIQDFTIQDGYIFSSELGTVAVKNPAMFVMDVLTTRQVDLDQLFPFASAPGFLETYFTTSEVISGAWRLYGADSNHIEQMSVMQSSVFGGGDGVASDRIYFTRLVLCNVYGYSSAIGESCLIPPANIVVQGITTKEPEYVHLERMRRSYTLQEG